MNKKRFSVSIYPKNHDKDTVNFELDFKSDLAQLISYLDCYDISNIEITVNREEL